MRTLAIGDIHGCFDALVALEALVDFGDDDILVTLGDYVDRGPDSRRVVEWLIQKHGQGCLRPLRGNHELLMFDARESEALCQRWIQVGGDQVLRSYGSETIGGIPETHWQFLSDELLPFYEMETHFFVHASAYSDVPLAEQPPYMLYWERFGHVPPHQSGKTMVCGHTIQKDGWPRSIGHAVCIDTGAYAGRWLTCLDVESGRCYQADQTGQSRQFWLDEVP